MTRRISQRDARRYKKQVAQILADARRLDRVLEENHISTYTAPAGADNVPAQAPSRGPWSLARRAMTSVARAGGGARRFRVAGGRYVRAKGGAKSAAASSAAGRATTAGLGGFLSGIATGGAAQAAQSIGLQVVVGQRAETVLAAVIDAIAPAGTTNDEAIARRAASETLRELFEKYGVEQNGIGALDAMKAADVAEAVELSVSAYVYQRWLFDLGLKIEEYAVSEAEAVRLERDVRGFVKGLVKLKLNGGKAIGLDWKGAAGKAFVQEVYEAAVHLTILDRSGGPQALSELREIKECLR